MVGAAIPEEDTPGAAIRVVEGGDTPEGVAEASSAPTVSRTKSAGPQLQTMSLS
jgi:hypothetical protein